MPKHIGLTIREKAFLVEYADSNGPNYGNGTQSALKVYPSNNYQTAAVRASKLLKREYIQTALEKILDDNGLRIEDRMQHLSDIVRGGAREVRHKDAKGVVTSTTEYEYTPTERIKAIDIASKLAGDYDRRRGEVDVATAEYKALIKAVFKGDPGTRAKRTKAIRGKRLDGDVAPGALRGDRGPTARG